MLCEICVWMLRGRHGQSFGGTLGLQFVHHDSAESFWTSVARDCSICRVLGSEVGANFFATFRRKALAHDEAFLDLRSLAHLSVVPPTSDRSDSIYRLDFSVEWAGTRIRHTFVLRPTGFQDIESPLRTPVADHMSHAEVLGVAKSWLQRCSCIPPERIMKRENYPTRLINLAKLKKLGKIDVNKWTYHGGLGLDELGNTTVNLVDSDELDWSKPVHEQYVTLSHKWGGTEKPARLTKRTEEFYRGGVRLRDLPQTFQEAIHFALGVDERVHYIWIDSLCIIQGDEQDWLKESDRMQDVYRNSFLNISATAAEHSGEGLYSHRVPQHLWEEVVRLDVDGLHQGEEKIRQKIRVNTFPRSNWGPNTIPTAGLTAVDLEYAQLAKVKSCLLVDVSNWETLVDQAPVNKRGWVVQERLLAPRVLHFCRGRIAWECKEFDDIEGHVPSIPNYQLIGDEIYEGIPMKGLEPAEHGKKLRNIRLRGMVDPLDLGRHNRKSNVVHSLELWSRIVEMYCKTDLTEQKDKLIALSGIAQFMSTVIAGSDKKGDQIQYVAGLWNVHLVSQLLWHVEPVYRGDTDSRADTIEYLSRRPTDYRAPSFSWASVDAQFGKGITCGHVLDSDGVLVDFPEDKDDTWLASETEDWENGVSVRSETTNVFGLVKSAHIRLWAWVHHVKLQRERTHYYWSLDVSNDSTTKPGVNEKRENFNVYLDCPSDDDQGNRLINSDGIYCIPIAYGSFSRPNDLICLLLEKVPADPESQDEYRKQAFNRFGYDQILKWPREYREWTFKRIGYTKLSATFDHFTWNYISHWRPSEKVSDKFYDGGTGRRLVCII